MEEKGHFFFNYMVFGMDHVSSWMWDHVCIRINGNFWDIFEHKYSWGRYYSISPDTRSLNTSINWTNEGEKKVRSFSDPFSEHLLYLVTSYQSVLSDLNFFFLYARSFCLYGLFDWRNSKNVYRLCIRCIFWFRPLVRGFLFLAKVIGVSFLTFYLDRCV